MVQAFYTKSISLGDKLNNLPRIRQVAAFAEEQGWSKNYFVKIIKEEYEARVRPHWNEILSTYAHFTGKKPQTEVVFETRTRPGSLESTQPLPFEVAELHFEASNHPSLPSFVAYIGIVHSLTEVKVLSSVVRLSQKGWTKRSPELSEIQWKYENYKWSEIVKEPRKMILEVLGSIESTILAYLQSLLPKQEVSQLAPEDEPQQSLDG